MAIKYAIEKHATAYPSKVLAREGGKHIYNIKLTTAKDNGNFVGKGAWLGLDLYAEAAPTSFAGIIREQATNGEWYVEVTDEPVNAYFVYQVPMIEEEYNNSFKLESNFYNEKDEIVRCYELAVGDIIAVSEEAFTAKPAATNTVSLTGNKLTPASAS